MRLDPKELADLPKTRNWERALDERVLDLAEEYFALQVLGQRRAFDITTTGQPLVYRSYANGLERQEGSPSAVYSSDLGVASLVRNLFEHQRVLGNDVVVWRSLPHIAERPCRLIFRCAFVQFLALRAQPMEQPNELF